MKWFLLVILLSFGAYAITIPKPEFNPTANYQLVNYNLDNGRYVHEGFASDEQCIVRAKINLMLFWISPDVEVLIMCMTYHNFKLWRESVMKTVVF